MFSFKSILLTITIILPFPSVAAADPFIDAVVLTMKHCYDDEKKISVQLGKCVLEKLNKIPNPKHYIVNLNGASPSDLILTIYNPSGFKIVCTISAQRTIEIKQCDSKPIAPITKGGELSISPSD